MNTQPIPANSVRTLQSMLRELSFHSPGISRLVPDGVFGEHTLKAVMAFQQQFYPPATGQVDAGTWDAVVKQYRQTLRYLGPDQPGTALHGPVHDTLPEGNHPHAGIIQAMYNALSRKLQNLGHCATDDICGRELFQNIQMTQRAAGLPMTGVMDEETWNTLVALYTIFVAFAQTPWQTRRQSLSGPRDTMPTDKEAGDSR